MTIKEELIAVMERIADTLPSRKVTVILCCEGVPKDTELYGSISSKGNLTIMTVVSSNNIILDIMDHAYNATRICRDEKI